MSIGVHDFEIPHEHVDPMRDMVIIRIPMPPKFIGSIEVPNVVRDLAQHNVQAGRIVAMGPLAFHYKDANPDGTERLSKYPAQIGDWVVIRPFAGTLLQGGKIQVNSGFRYVSSFQDVLAVIPADKMPDVSTLLWTEEEANAQQPLNFPTAAQPLPEDVGVRERTKYPTAKK